MIQVRINYTFGSQIFKAETMEQAKELQTKLYNAFADGGCRLPLDRIEIRLIISQESKSIKALREYLKNKGKNKREVDSRVAAIIATKDCAECKIEMLESDKDNYGKHKPLCELLTVKVDKCTVDVNVSFIAQMLYFAVENDFNGEIWISNTAVNKFVGKMRQTLLCPMSIERTIE